MANTITGRTWILDTVTGLVTTNPVYIKSILVTWKVASAGEIILTEPEADGNRTSGRRILKATTSGATSAAFNNLTQQFTINREYHGVWKDTMTDIADIDIITA